MATMAAHYDMGRFGAERLSFSPRQADLLMVMGTIAKKMGPILKQVYTQMAEPRWVLSMGPVLPAEAYLILIAYCKALTGLSLWMYMFPVALPALNRFWMVL